jgi:hypothetical protein
MTDDESPPPTESPLARLLALAEERELTEADFHAVRAELERE